MKYTNEQIQEICRFVQADFLGNWYLDKLRAQAKAPDPFYPMDLEHKPSQRFLLSSGLYWLFHPDEHGRHAFGILERPRVKEFVESMIVSNAPSVAIADAVGKQYRFKCHSSAIDRYREFFWNVDLVDSTELRALLQLRVDQIEVDANGEVRLQHKALRNASYKDARKSAADLPFSPLSALIAQMRMGVIPSEIDLLRVVKTAQSYAAIRALEATIANGKGDSSRAIDFASVVEKFANVVKETTQPEADLRDQLATIAMRTDDAPLPTIHQLSQGRHTAEVMVMETTNAVPADFDEDGEPDEPVA
jgi:hypothetical protein